MLELENEFQAEDSIDSIKFSLAESKDLKAAVKEHPNHHVFVDEYVLDLEKKDDICEMMRELKQFTKVKTYFFYILWMPCRNEESFESDYPDFLIHKCNKTFHICQHEPFY